MQSKVGGNYLCDHRVFLLQLQFVGDAAAVSGDMCQCLETFVLSHLEGDGTDV